MWRQLATVAWPWIASVLLVVASRLPAARAPLSEISKRGVQSTATAQGLRNASRLMRGGGHERGSFVGQAFCCEEKCYTLGDWIATGAQGQVYFVEGERLVAKIAHQQKLWAFNVEECKYSQTLHDHGIHAPACAGQCKYCPRDDDETDILPVLLFEQVPGDTLSNLYAWEEGVNCIDFKDQVLIPWGEEFAKMLNAGFANPDQHKGNVMFGGGKIWLIDFGIDFTVRPNSDVPLDRWLSAMWTMVSNYVSDVAYLLSPDHTECSPEVEATDMYNLFVAKLDEKRHEEKHHLCGMLANFELKSCHGFS